MLLFTFLIIVSCISNDDKTDKNKFYPGALWRDTDGNHINAHGAGFLIHEGIYYWFGEHKGTGERGSKAEVGVRVYSSEDLYNWTNEGIALSVLDDISSKLQKGCVLERPKVIYNKKTDKFVMWFHHELKDHGYKAALTGVAVSDRVTGPFEYIDSFRIHAGVLPQNFSEEQFSKAEEIIDRNVDDWKEKVIQGGYLKRDFEVGQMSRDMTLFVDDDNTAYHITASEENNTLLISKLTDDYLSLTDQYVRALPGGRNEAPAIFKKDGKYFMFSSGLTGWKPNPGKLSISDDMMGEWRHVGNPCVGTDEERNTTFWSQCTYVIPVLGMKDTFIYVGDRWKPKDHQDGRYIWLPMEFEDGIPFIKWYDEWNLSKFKQI